MTYISLREFIDDILLIVRNNNISESEDLSRTQIANWIKAHKAAILKERLDKQKENALNPDDDEDAIDNMFKNKLIIVPPNMKLNRFLIKIVPSKIILDINSQIQEKRKSKEEN